MMREAALVVDAIDDRADTIILSGMADEYKVAIRALTQKCRTMTQSARKDRAPQRPKKFAPKKKDILKGGGQVNPEANKRADIIRSRAARTGRFEKLFDDDDSAA